jgi:hypothetical protein
MNTYSQLQYAEVNEVYRAWPVPEAESVRIENGSTFRPAVAAVALGLLFGAVLATVVSNLSAPASPVVDSQDDSNTVVLMAPHHTRAYKLTPAPPAMLAASPVSRFAEAPRIPFVIEGDATVADFDSAGGMIQTDAGKSFLIGTSADTRMAGLWQDYHHNVHYRCDQSGNCTISGAGVVVSNARLTF